ncbi:MAG TPA: zinc-binding dehydrogenase [Gaiellaceae bacterium]|nr:zinc-binding dehydrogenase [Gaiellaceae bacterium]
MLAARVRAIGSEPVLEEAPEPEPAPGETLVAVDAAAVGHLEPTIWSGALPFHPPAPYIPGTDAAGRVVASPEWPEGARVWIRGGGVGFVRDGCWAPRVAVPGEALHVLPDGVDPVVGATFFVPWSTAHAALFAVGGLEPGERVGVRGATGAVGSLAVQLSLAAGAAEVLAGTRGRTDALPEGATPLRDDEWGGLGKERAVDLLVDAVGGDGLDAALDAVRPGGRVVLVGYVAGERTMLAIPRLLARDVRLLPANQMRHEPALFLAAPAALAHLARGGLHVRTRAFPLAQLGSALGALREGGGRVALTFAG